MNAFAKIAVPIEGGTSLVEFRNAVQARKFIRFKHVLVDGVSHQSEAGSTGSVLGVDCCDAFLEYAPLFPAVSINRDR